MRFVAGPPCIATGAVTLLAASSALLCCFGQGAAASRTGDVVTINEAYRNFADSGCGTYPDEAYSGTLLEFWGNGGIKYRGTFEQGRKRVGLHTCFWENGTLREVGFWQEGWNRGTLIRFREDGSKELERDYGEQGAETRSWTERRYSFGSSRLVVVEQWVNGELASRWVDEELARALQDAETEHD